MKRRMLHGWSSRTQRSKSSARCWILTVVIAVATRHSGAEEVVSLMALGGDLSESACVLKNCTKAGGTFVQCWGKNSYGELGYGDTTVRGASLSDMGANLPHVDLGTGVQAKTLVRVSGGAHRCVITMDDRLKCWGYNQYGVLGHGSSGHKGDGPNEMGDNLPYTDLGTNRRVKMASGGSNTMCAILDNDQLKCWGQNNKGQLGYGDTQARGTNAAHMGDNLPALNLGSGRTATSISCSYGSCCVILDNGESKCWGYQCWDNFCGSIAAGHTDQNIGDSSDETPDQLPNVNVSSTEKCVAFDGGKYHRCCILTSGDVKCFGNNQFGQQLGYDYGGGAYNNVGDAIDELGDFIQAVPLGGKKAVAITCGVQHCCVLLVDSTIKCWGNNRNNGVMGTSSSGSPFPDAELGTGRTAFSVSAGQLNTLVHLSDNEVYCFGKNNDGSCGLGVASGAITTYGDSMQSVETASCECDAGFFGFPCTQCAAGTFKQVLGTEPCSNCPSGTYSAALGQTSNSTCQHCPDKTVSSDGSGSIDDCQCVPGYSGSAGNCSACPTGHYKGVNGTTSCVLCEVGKYANKSGSASCHDCPPNSGGFTGSIECTCNSGYHKIGSFDCARESISVMEMFDVSHHQDYVAGSLLLGNLVEVLQDSAAQKLDSFLVDNLYVSAVSGGLRCFNLSEVSDRGVCFNSAVHDQCNIQDPV